MLYKFFRSLIVLTIIFFIGIYLISQYARQEFAEPFILFNPTIDLILFAMAVGSISYFWMYQIVKSSPELLRFNEHIIYLRSLVKKIELKNKENNAKYIKRKFTVTQIELQSLLNFFVKLKKHAFQSTLFYIFAIFIVAINYYDTETEFNLIIFNGSWLTAFIIYSFGTAPIIRDITEYLYKIYLFKDKDEKSKKSLIFFLFIIVAGYLSLMQNSNIPEPNNPKVKVISQYISQGDISNSESLENTDAIFWVDWKEYDEDIVAYVANSLQEKELSTRIEEIDDEREYNLFITYKGHESLVIYQRDNVTKEYPYRDTTIITLNHIIKDDYEIRFLIQKDYGDTLAFAVLKNDEWEYLDKKHKNINMFFEKINKNSSFFGS